MRTEYISTKVRPIKKLFIIEHDDYESFAKLFKEIQDEIDIIQNLIFVNDTDLWSQPNKEFIKRSDPDIILNLSKLDDEKLSLHFGVFSVKPITDHYKIGRFGTNLFSFTKLPTIIERFSSKKDIDFVVLSASKLENTAESLLACINYGLFQKETKIHLPLTIFKKLKATILTKKEDLIKSIFDNDKKFIRLTTEIGSLGGSGHGSSIYEVDYNNEGLFNNKKKYFFVSEKNDFKTIAYFWNTRSYYSYSDIAWVPVDFIKDISSLVDTETIFVCLHKAIEKKIKKLFPTCSIIQPTRLYFRGRNERWTFFEHTQTISITDKEAIILHPAEKNFSDIGSMGAFVLETRGLREFIYPKRRSIGKLFFPKHHDDALFENQFQRISELGLSTYVLKVSPLKAEDISELIALPTFNEIIKHLFEDVGYSIKTTQKSSILEQTINLLGGVGDLNIISTKHVFDLLVSLTPKVRTERIVKKLLEGAGEKITSDNILEIIAEIREKGAVNFPSVTLTIEEIVAKTLLSGNEKKKLFPILQKLYDQRIFLRGKYFPCPSCGSNLWIQIDEISRVNYCVECSNLVNLPVYLNDKQDSDYFRLNQLIVRAVDQGQLSTLLLLNLFFQQKYRAFDYQSNLEVFKYDILITDIDLLIKIGKKIGVAECKSTSGFSENQVDELIKIASSLQCDFIAFSSLIDSTSQELKDLVTILNKKSLEIPAFIFTNESLFNPKSNMIQKHFELWHRNDFSKGAIII
jgi:hypothetical protein